MVWLTGFFRWRPALPGRGRGPWDWLGLLGLLLWPAAQAAEPQVVCASISPFAFVQQGDYRGYAYELGQEAMRRLGYGGQIRVQPLPRAYRTVQTEANVIALWMGRIPEREQRVHWLYPSIPSRANPAPAPWRRPRRWDCWAPISGRPTPSPPSARGSREWS